MAEPAPEPAAIEPKPWDRGIAPHFIGLFLGAAYFDQIPRWALSPGGLLWPALGAAIAGLLSFGFLYYAPAVWGQRAGRGFAGVSEATFGVVGARRFAGLIFALAQIGWFAIATFTATQFALRGLATIGLIDPSQVGPEGPDLRGTLFLVTALFWAFAFGMVGFYAIRPVAAIMSVFPIFPALAIGGAAAWGMVGLRDFQATGLDPLSGQPAGGAGPWLGFTSTAQLIFAFFAVASPTASDWGAACRSPRDARLGGLVGVAFASAILAVLALLIVAGGLGREASRRAELSDRPAVVRGMMPNPAMPVDGRRGRPMEMGPARTVGEILQAGLGGLPGAATLFILSVGSMAPAVYAASSFGGQLRGALPSLPTRRWINLGALASFPLIAFGLPTRADILYGVLGALVAPLIGAIAADFVRHRGAWPGARPGVRPAAVVAWLFGLFVGLIAPFGRLRGSLTLAHFEPSSLWAFISAFCVYFILATFGLEPRRPAATETRHISTAR